MHQRRRILQPRGQGPSIVPLLGIFFLLMVAGGATVAGYQTLRPLLSMTGQIVPRPTEAVPAATAAAAGSARDQASSGPGATASADQPGSAVAVNREAATPGMPNQSRVNVLLLGSDNDAKFDNGAVLTQSMIVVTIDPGSKTVGMLSIPRDFWVRIPGYGYGKIDTAYELGGIALARRTVEEDFGIPINYYAWVGLVGFQKVVDEMGGINIDVLHPVTDNEYPDDLTGNDPYAYSRLYIPAGPQHLDGATALQYVRSRHGDLVGDFGRSQRQQQVLLTLKKKAEQPATVAKIPAMIGDLQDSVRTDFNLIEIAKYANFARQIQRSSIKQVVLSPPDYSANGTSPDGAQAVVYPNWRAIDAAVKELFTLTTTPTSAARGDTGVVAAAAAAARSAEQGQGTRPVATLAPRGVAGAEATSARPATPTPSTSLDARSSSGPRLEATSIVLPTPTSRPSVAPAVPIVVQVQNGTSVPGLGQRATNFLSSNGYRTVSPVTATRATYQQTVVYSLDPAARDVAFAVGRLFGATVVQESGGARASGPSIIVILGADVAKRF